MALSNAIIKLLQQLFKQSYRQDKSFDKYQVRFLKKLQQASSTANEIELFEECNEQLNAIPTDQEDCLLEGRLIVSQSQIQLQRMESISETLKNKVREAQSIHQPYTMTEHHNELTELIKIYQRVVIELNKQPAQESSDKALNFEMINDKLQQLILEIDVGGEHATKLEEVRLVISKETDAFNLPSHCLNIINIIINSTREERRSSRHFLYTLNDSLTQFYLNFAQTLKVTEVEFGQQKEVVSSIQQKSQLLKKHTTEAQDLTSLREHIFEYVTQVEKVIEVKEQQQDKQFRYKFQGMVRQIKELQSETQGYQKTLKQQSQQLHIDFLTKIPNRAAWSERLDMEVARFLRYKEPLNLAVIDIDKFKNINDTYGHLAGDKVLNVIAQSLQKTIRNVDYIARFGGEEFTLLLPNISPDQSFIALNKLRNKIKSIPFKFKQKNVTVTISIGYTTFLASDDADKAFNRADDALYKAKRNGRNQVLFLGDTTP